MTSKSALIKARNFSKELAVDIVTRKRPEKPVAQAIAFIDPIIVDLLSHPVKPEAKEKTILGVRQLLEAIKHVAQSQDETAVSWLLQANDNFNAALAWYKGFRLFKAKDEKAALLDDLAELEKMAGKEDRSIGFFGFKA